MRKPEELATAIVEDFFAPLEGPDVERMIAQGIRQAVAVYQLQLAQKVLAAHNPGELDEEEAVIDYILSLVEADPWSKDSK